MLLLKFQSVSKAHYAHNARNTEFAELTLMLIFKQNMGWYYILFNIYHQELYLLPMRLAETCWNRFELSWGSSCALGLKKMTALKWELNIIKTVSLTNNSEVCL